VKHPQMEDWKKSIEEIDEKVCLDVITITIIT
jgi:hypothetical protein